MTGKTRRVLLIHRFFYPDSPPYALILEDIRKLFASKGYCVDVLSSQPSYKKVDKEKTERFVTRVNENSRIVRLPVFRFKFERVEKLLNYFWFPFVVFCFVLFARKYKIVTVSTAPPVLLAFLVSLAARIRGSKLIYHCMDIHPEIGRISGEFASKFIFNVLKWMDNFTCKAACRIIVLSSDMKASLTDRNDCFSGKIEIINNYDLTAEKLLERPLFASKSKKKRIVFTGNIGRFQNLDVFISALKKNDRLENLELLFVGEGSALSELKEQAADLDEFVKFIPHQPVSVARQIIAEADMGIVSLHQDVIRYAYPSKTMTYLAEGTPLLVCVNKTSELAEFIEATKVGVVLEPSDLDGIFLTLEKLANDEMDISREHVKFIFNENFSKQLFINKLNKLIDGLAD